MTGDVKKSRFQLWLVVKIAVLLIVIMFGFAAFERFMLFPGTWLRRDYQSKEDLLKLEQFEIWERKFKQDKTVEALFLKSGQSPATGMIVFAHGNAELIDDWALFFQPFQEKGYHVLIPEYRGFGRSQGKPNSDDIVSDYVFFLDEFKKRHSAFNQSIIYYGRSIGGGIVANLLTQRPPDALILQSTFSRLSTIAWQTTLVPKFVISAKMEILDYIKDYNKPLLIFHGRTDTVIPYAHSETIKAAKPNATFITYACDHNDFPPDLKVYWKDLFEFLSEI